MENGVYPTMKSNRCNVDTGSVFGGRLTAAIFDETQHHPIGFIQDQEDLDGIRGEDIERYIPQLLIDKANQ